MFSEVGFGGQTWKYLSLIFLGMKLLGVQDGWKKERNVERNSDNSDK